MAYKYFGLVTSGSPNQIFINDFQTALNDGFALASDLFTIQEELTIGSGSFVDTQVRINTAISTQTGKSLGDDFKKILFQNITHTVGIGRKFIFDNNTWLTINTEAIKNLAAASIVRRCNSVLRWIDENGNYQEEPIVLEYDISRPRDQMGTENLVLPEGYVTGYIQSNTNTKKIKGNKRFLFGPTENRIAMRIFGNGIRNFLNQTTYDDSSANIIMLSLGGNFVNPDTDNLTLGVADYYKDTSTLTSGSNIGALDIIVSPNINYILESGSQIFNVNYYSGSSIHSGSFVFSVNDNKVPTANYVFATENNNAFSIFNMAGYYNDTLNILASGSSGSRILALELRGAF